jgi:NADPH:quinone reductase-like Zn-dependent oxidoreductase
MIGGTVGEVIASENPQWQIGDRVAGMFGWVSWSQRWSGLASYQARISRCLPILVFRDAGDDGMVWRTSDSETGR